MILCEVANTLDEDLQMTYNVPSFHDSRRLPVLDLEMFVDEVGNLSFSFYSKPISNPFCILYRSAISANMKRNALFQEGLRRLNNMSDNI